VQKAVEIGAAGVIPMAVDFSTVKYDEAKKTARRERWQKIAQEAAKQCGRDLVPTVTPIRSLSEVLAEAGPDTAIIMLYEKEITTSLKASLTGCLAKSYLLLVGPEGGFSPAEATLCREKGARIVTIGPRILRTETAALAALAIVLYQNGDLGG
jgi:16S rRNA (uracil1498-N3)-methyltransferase